MTPIGRRSAEGEIQAFKLIELPAVSERKRSAFTLIELLVVIAIIGILAAILLPAINSAINQGERTRAKADVRSVVSAWKAYYNEYGKWPVTNAIFLAGAAYSANATEGICVGLLTTTVVVRLLAPGSISVSSDSLIQKYNPKNGNFLTYDQESMDSSSHSLVDPWGNLYRFLFDLNGDGRVTNPVAGQNVYDSVIAWSAGPDGKDNTPLDNKDNINSWE